RDVPGPPAAAFGSSEILRLHQRVFPRIPMATDTYLPVLLLVIVGALVGAARYVGGSVIGPNKPDEATLSPYESGFDPFGDARMKFDVRYYLIAILFILFDLEIAFLFPWAMANDHVGMLGFWTAAVFLAILVVGFIYEW